MDTVIDYALTYLETPVRRRNRELNLSEYQQRLVRIESRPLALFVELTQNCNLRCPMCRYGEKYNPTWNMDVSLFHTIAEELFPTALIVDIRGWGESTILHNFPELLRVAASYRPQLRLVTNAQVNREVVWDILMSAHAMITISCDAADPDLFEQLRLGGTIKRLKATTRAIVAARDHYGVPHDNLMFNTVVSRANLSDLPNVVSLAAELDVPKVILHPIVTDLTDPGHLRGDLDGTELAYQAAAARARAGGVVLQLGAAPDPALALPDKVRMPPCMHPWAYAYVNYAGGVGFCDHLIGSDRFVLGSLREKSFEEIWNGSEWMALRANHIAGEIPDRFAPCRYSYAQRYVDFEDRIHPDRAAGVVSTLTELELTLRRDPAEVQAVHWL